MCYGITSHYIQMSVHLVAPLLSMVSELCHRQEELVRLLVKKDKEIQDYKDHGAEVSRSKAFCTFVL